VIFAWPIPSEPAATGRRGWSTLAGVAAASWQRFGITASYRQAYGVTPSHTLRHR
jgi:hypothetical protein